MRHSSIIRALKLAAFVIIVPGALCQPMLAQEQFEHPKFPPPAHERQQSAVERNLKIFDVLDFDVFSNQKWDRLGESHAAESSSLGPTVTRPKESKSTSRISKLFSCGAQISRSKCTRFASGRPVGPASRA